MLEHCSDERQWNEQKGPRPAGLGEAEKTGRGHDLPCNGHLNYFPIPTLAVALCRYALACITIVVLLVTPAGQGTHAHAIP
jgi:hypothetical protein